MSGQKFKRISSTPVDESVAGFGIFDDKGREIGYRMTFFRNVWIQVPDDVTTWHSSNPAFEARTTATRSGIAFGASTNPVTGETLEECRANAEKRRDGALARYRKKFGASS